jgi:hypothetical protein
VPTSAVSKCRWDTYGGTRKAMLDTYDGVADERGGRKAAEHWAKHTQMEVWCVWPRALRDAGHD